MSKNAIILRKTLNKDQIAEYDLLKNISEKLLADNYHRNPMFQFLIKTRIGYTIARYCRLKNKIYCRWNIYINIEKNEAFLSCNKECEHKNPIKRKGLF